ncbi:hypothetical protein [Wocania ichthyoenteri]|uniref:hypothetical protein n=1 Tax=Wocania ichthyoenteri TaxID=1230531 RepID=UPI00053D7A8D|nr:hypothetical protein [Wocania ichthyoenteri]
MYKSKVLIGLIVFAYILFVVFQFSGDEVMASSFSSITFPLIGLLYFVSVKPKTVFFSLFLIFYALSELLFFAIDFIPYLYFYYIGNILSMLSYAFLLFEICKSVCGFHVLKNYKIHVLVLTGLNIYIAYILQEAISPYLELTNEYIIEITYNVTMLLLLSVSLLNYFYKGNKKSLFYFFGALCIVFSEVINVAYLYVAHQNALNFISVSLFLLAFYFLYQQSKLENLKVEEIEISTNVN